MSSSTSAEETPNMPTDSNDSNDPTVFRRMLAGGPYNAADPHVQYQAQVGRDKVHAINQAKDGKERMELFSQWARMGPKGNAYVALPFFCEYVSTRSLSWISYQADDHRFVLRIPTCRYCLSFDYRLPLQVFNLTIGDDVYIGPNNTFLDVTPSKPLST